MRIASQCAWWNWSCLGQYHQAYAHWLSPIAGITVGSAKFSTPSGLDAIEECIRTTLPSEPAAVPTLLDYHQNHKFKVLYLFCGVDQLLYGKLRLPDLSEVDEGRPSIIYQVAQTCLILEIRVAILHSNGEIFIRSKSGKELGISVRDMPMFAKPRHTAQDARIAIRDSKIMVRTDLVRAIVHRSSLVLFECRKPALSEKVGVAILLGIRAAKQKPDGTPFELKMLEALLQQTLRYLEEKASRIKLVSLAVQEHINRNVNTADVRRLLPLQKAVTALEYDIRETKHAVATLADNDKQLASLCLSEDQNLTRQSTSWTPHMKLAHNLLLAYDSRIRALDSDLRELREHLDSTREVLHMQLDAMRNQIIRTNLHLEYAGLSAIAASLPAGIASLD